MLSGGGLYVKRRGTVCSAVGDRRCRVHSFSASRRDLYRWDTTAIFSHFSGHADGERPRAGSSRRVASERSRRGRVLGYRRCNRRRRTPEKRLKIAVAATTKRRGAVPKKNKDKKKQRFTRPPSSLDTSSCATPTTRRGSSRCSAQMM